MGLFNKKIKVTFIDKKWNRIAENVRISAVPKTHELVYLNTQDGYYRVSQVIYWPNQSPDIFIVIESLSEMEKKYDSILNKRGDEFKK
jgi:hypothetical protein